MNIPESLVIEWTDFQKNITESFQNVRLSTEFSDVTLVFDGDDDPIEAHRLVLAAGSTFFQKVVGEKSRSHPHPMLYLAGVNRPHIEYILDFLYNGQTKLPNGELPGFLQTAKSLGIKGLEEEAETEDFTNTPLKDMSNCPIQPDIETKEKRNISMNSVKVRVKEEQTEVNPEASLPSADKICCPETRTSSQNLSMFSYDSHGQQRKRCRQCVRDVHGKNYKVQNAKLSKFKTQCSQCGVTSCPEHSHIVCLGCCKKLQKTNNKL